MSGKGKAPMPPSTNPVATSVAEPSGDTGPSGNAGPSGLQQGDPAVTDPEVAEALQTLNTFATMTFDEGQPGLAGIPGVATAAIGRFQDGALSREELLNLITNINKRLLEFAAPSAESAETAQNIAMLLAADGAAAVDMATATVAANRTVGREDARGQLGPAKRIANWIKYRSQICGVPVPSEVMVAAETFLDRWPETFQPGHPGKGTAACWICGQQIKDGDHSEIEHVLGMRPSAYRFTALCTPTTLEFGGLTQDGWYKLNHASMSALKNPLHPVNDLDKLLCNVNWNCIYDFLYNYAPAHRCCNQVKGNINETTLSFLTRPIQVPGRNLPVFIPDPSAIQYLLENIIAKIKEGKSWNCTELNDYLEIFDAHWVKQRILTIINDYLTPLRNPNSCLEDSPMGLLAQTIIARDARNMDFIEANNQSIIEYTRSINGTSLTAHNLPGLPYQHNHKSPDEPTFQLLAYEMKISPDELIKRLDSGNLEAIKRLIDMRRRRKRWEDQKQPQAAAKKGKKHQLEPDDSEHKTKKKKGGKRRYTKKIHFRSNLRKNTRKAKKKYKKHKKTKKTKKI